MGERGLHSLDAALDVARKNSKQLFGSPRCVFFLVNVSTFNT